jgi:protein O-GlcNAc transferase
MRSQALSAPTSLSLDPFTPTVTDRDESLSRIGASASALRAELAASTDEIAGVGPHSVRMAVRGFAREIAAAIKPNRRDAWVQETLGFIKATSDIGAHDLPANPSDIETARELATEGWNGLLAAMLLVPSWQLSQTPALDDVPDWLWREYVAWLFTTPLRFSNPELDATSDHAAKRLRDLERLVNRNTGSAAIRAAINGYLQATGKTIAAGDPIVWRQQIESRGKMLARVHVRGRSDYDPVVSTRHGRRLRVGFVARDFGPSPATYSALASFEQLDAKAFDAFLFPLVANDTPEAQYCARRVRATQVLPEGTTERVALLRNSQLDVIVFVGDLAAEWSDLAELALHRIAPLQVVDHRSGFSTGLPEIDLYVSGSEISSAAFTERVGLVRGPAYSIAFAQGDAAPAAPLASRLEVGLPVDRPVFVTLVDVAGADQSRLEKWAEMMAQNESTHLAIAFAHEGPGSELTRFCSAVDRALAKHDVEQTRVTIFPTSAARPHESRALIALGDVFLDADGGSFGAWATAEALRAGVPVVAASNRSDYAPAFMLESLDLADFVATDLDSYARLALTIAVDTVRRNKIRERICAAMEATPAFMDTLAASDAFGALLESAFDELASLGRAEFRRQNETIRCFGVENPGESVDAGLAAHANGDIDTAAMEANLALRSAPADTRARYLQGLVLHAQGNTSRAVDYLLAAVQRSDATPGMWYSLALALRDNRQPGEAIQVLETCLRLDNRNVPALFTLLELAEAAGATEIARDVLDCLKEVAPEDPRVLALS